MPEKDHRTRLSCTTAKAYFFKKRSPKSKYIQDPSDFVDNNYKQDYSQYLIPYDVMSVNITPIWGPFSTQLITLTYDWDKIQISIIEKQLDLDVMSVQPGISPEYFTGLCMEAVHGPATCDRSRIPRIHSGICLPTERSRYKQPATLLTCCLRSIVVQTSVMQSESLLQCLPKELHGHFSNNSNITVSLKIWPKDSKQPRCTTMNACQGMVVAEFFWLVRYFLKFNSQTKFRLYRNFVPLDNQDVLSDDDIIDVIVIPDQIKVSEEKLNKRYVLSKVGPKEFEISGKEVLFVSLLGKGTKEILINPSDTLYSLDIAIRQTFRLRCWTFLAYKHPTQEKFLLQASKVIKSKIDEEKVKILIENKRRNFPCSGATGIPMKRLYKDSPFYNKSLHSLGFYSGCFVEVFEVTGPTVPILLCGDVIESYALDVNSSWLQDIFLYYIRLCTGRGERFTNIDCGSILRHKNVGGILEMMGSLWRWDRQTSKGTKRLEYLKIKV